jgi:PAS domain S-box-containing protein
MIMNASAHALENLALNLHFKQIRDGLEKAVENRTQEVRQAYDQVRLVLDSIQAGVVVIDMNTYIIQDINPAGCRILGLEREDIVGKECFERFCPAQRGACPAMDLGKNVVNQERLVPTTDGRELYILKSAVRAKLGGLDVIIESFVDLTEQKKLSQLREDVDRITRHDLKAPLTGIISVPDLLLDYESFDADERELLTLIKDSGLKMLNMINFSLDLFKMETGTYETAFVPVDVASTITHVLRDMGSLISSKGLVACMTLDGMDAEKRSFFLLGEELLFFSLFSNLLKNAIEASPEDGKLTISLESGDNATIRIGNEGVVPDEMKDRFFDKYATSGKFGGTGLGTYSAKLIVENLGGEISFTSDDGVVIISIRLPQATGF